MDVRYRVDHEHRLIVVQGPEHITGALIGEALRTVFEDDAFEPGYCRLWDLRNTRQLDVLPQHFKEHTGLIEAKGDKFAEGKSAILVRREIDEIAGQLYMARARQILGIQGEVFYSVQSAAEFLNVPVEACYA
jgi:hypothetical protein